MERVDVVVLGAGAAGMFCAAEAARRGRRVLVLDHAAAPGEKIRISGGGRCNFTNLHTAPDRFHSRNPRFAASALARFTPRDFVARIEAAGIAWHEKAQGQLFCDGSARQVVDMLLRDLARGGAELRLHTAIEGVARQGEGFRVATAAGAVDCGRLVVATGGKSIPKMGATGLGYRIAETFGLPLVEPRPGLVPLTFGEPEIGFLAALAGVAVPGARVAAARGGFADALLFTHRGLSGPAVLQASSCWREGEEIAVDLLPGQDLAAMLRAARGATPKLALRSALAQHLPDRLARALAERASLAGPLGAISNAGLAGLARQLQDWRLKPTGSEGWRTAEVTLGGVDTAALDAKTLAARTVPGLHFIGEVVDVTGWLGGYNFQWAWSSAWAAAQAV